QDQLGWVDHALMAGRFFRQDLASELGAEQVAPAILLQGAASSGAEPPLQRTSRGSVHRVGRAMILGVDDRFWFEGTSPSSSSTQLRAADPRPGSDDLWAFAKEEVVLNTTLAKELSVAAGDRVTLHMQEISAVPRETLLGRRDAGEVVDELTLTV